MEEEKKYLSLAIVVLSILVSGYFGFLWWKKEKTEELEEVSYNAFLVAKNLREGNYEEGLKIIEKLEDEYGNHKMVLFAKSYSLLIDNFDKKGDISEELYKSFEDKDVKNFFIERTAYERADYRILGDINKNSFNYESAMLLKAILLMREGKKKEANEIFSELAGKDLPYISSVADFLKER